MPEIVGNQTNNDNIKVLVIGLGQLGYPVAQYVKHKGFDTYGYDTSIKAMVRAEGTCGIKRANSFKNFDVYILCISTHKPDNILLPYTDGLTDIAKKIAEEADDDALVCIESTIPAGTSRRICGIFNHRLHVAHIPHRWYALEQDMHGVNQLRVAGGVQPCCLVKAMQFYTGRSSLNELTTHESKDSMMGNLGIPIHPVENAEIAELTKTVENAHRFLQIAFAEELYIWCSENNIDFWGLRSALNTKWNVDILEPRDGIGGHCLPKDTMMFLRSSEVMRSKIITSAVEVDREYKYYKKFKEEQNNSASSTMSVGADAAYHLRYASGEQSAS